MKLYLLTTDEAYPSHSIGEYSEVLVAAESADAARLVHPKTEWVKYTSEKLWHDAKTDLHRVWASGPDKVKVEYIGEAATGIAAGVLLASFNDGY